MFLMISNKSVTSLSFGFFEQEKSLLGLQIGRFLSGYIPYPFRKTTIYIYIKYKYILHII